ncbi:hypothetical protein PAXRUDRAFT_821392 [Paxillus rubicundulus Ve08.2h10]|uniref:Uncharacterized protein n=1 Tax=Paxillus rubicundulus Ve08.2h10 TaxID=930991 RepID=A0A0D0EAU8_9AGAM|nr:hypothetical protein PAXRUDRAFT_821392 [Paxillus rubicundulus Ve08.2h10]
MHERYECRDKQPVGIQAWSSNLEPKGRESASTILFGRVCDQLRRQVPSLLPTNVSQKIDVEI